MNWFLRWLFYFVIALGLCAYFAVLYWLIVNTIPLWVVLWAAAGIAALVTWTEKVV